MAGATAQYPLIPSPVIDARALSIAPAFSGYVAVRNTRHGDTSAFSVSRARLTLMAAPMPFATIRIQADFAAAGRIRRDSSVQAFALTDAFVQLQAPDSNSMLARHRSTLLVGQFRVPFSLEYLTPFAQLLTPSRSLAVDRLAPRRDVGAMVQLEPVERVMVAASFTNGEGANVATNADRRELAAARLTVIPLPSLALAAKIANQGADHLSGYDARWLRGALTLEGEVVRRERPSSASQAALRGSGGYLLGSYRVLPWLSPVLKWEQERERAPAATSATWVTYGIATGESSHHLRTQLAWTTKRDHPTDVHDNELLAQLILMF